MEILKNFRISLNLTIKEFAEIIGVSQSLYEKIEQGKRKPSSNFIKRLKGKYPQFDTNLLFYPYKAQNVLFWREENRDEYSRCNNWRFKNW